MSSHKRVNATPIGRRSRPLFSPVLNLITQVAGPWKKKAGKKLVLRAVYSTYICVNLWPTYGRWILFFPMRLSCRTRARTSSEDDERKMVRTAETTIWKNNATFSLILFPRRVAFSLTVDCEMTNELSEIIEMYFPSSFVFLRDKESYGRVPPLSYRTYPVYNDI